MLHTIINITVVSFILMYWLYKIVRYTYYRPYNNLKRSRSNKGSIREAKVLSVINISKQDKNPVLKVELELENFLYYPIIERIRFTDTKYLQKRYEVGKTFKVKLDSGQRPKSPISMIGSKIRVSKSSIIFYTVFVLIYLFCIFFIVKQTEQFITSHFYDYEQLFRDSSILKLIIGFSTIYLFIHLIFRTIGLIRTKKMLNEDWDMKYYGIKTIAEIKKYMDTGSLINDNPIVRFDYAFKDEKGQIIEGSDSMIINKLEVIKLPELKEMDIVFVPDNLHRSKFASNLDSRNSSRFIEAIMMFVLFVFSVVIVFNFILIFN